MSIVNTIAKTCICSTFFLLLSAPHSKAVTTSFTAIYQATASIDESYGITIESSTSALNMIEMFCDNTTHDLHQTTHVEGNLNFPGPGTFGIEHLCTGLASYEYSCRGDGRGHNPSGQWYCGSTEVFVTVP